MDKRFKQVLPPKEIFKMANRFTQRDFMSLIIREMQVKIFLRHHYQSTTTAKI